MLPRTRYEVGKITKIRYNVHLQNEEEVEGQGKRKNGIIAAIRETIVHLREGDCDDKKLRRIGCEKQPQRCQIHKYINKRYTLTIN